MAAEYLMEFVVSFMVEADGEQAAAEIAGAFVNTAIEVALWERDGAYAGRRPLSRTAAALMGLPNGLLEAIIIADVQQLHERSHAP